MENNKTKKKYNPNYKLIKELKLLRFQMSELNKNIRELIDISKAKDKEEHEEEKPDEQFYVLNEQLASSDNIHYVGEKDWDKYCDYSTLLYNSQETTKNKPKKALSIKNLMKK